MQLFLGANFRERAFCEVRRTPSMRSSQNSILLEEAVVDCGCMKCPQCLRRKGRCFPIERASASTKGGCVMKKVLLVFGVSAVLLLLLASAAFAQNYGGSMNASPTASASASASPTASPTATATATASATASATATASPLPTTGGPPLVGPLTWVATLTLIGSGVGALRLLRGGGAVS